MAVGKNLPRVLKVARPFLFDVVINQIQDHLASQLSWLTHCFGRCERLVKDINGRRVYTPNVYAGKNEYILLTPDSRLGNYAFFVVEEPERIKFERGVRGRYRAPFSLIVWVDMRKVSDNDDRNTEEVKDAIVKAVNSAMPYEGGLTVDRIYNHAERVFEGFSLDEVDNQFLMAPFCGWRLTGELWVYENCVEPEPEPDDNDNNNDDDNG